VVALILIVERMISANDRSAEVSAELTRHLQELNLSLRKYDVARRSGVSERCLNSYSSERVGAGRSSRGEGDGGAWR
jgi:hypothetical protein